MSNDKNNFHNLLKNHIAKKFNENVLELTCDWVELVTCGEEIKPLNGADDLVPGLEITVYLISEKQPEEIRPYELEIKAKVDSEGKLDYNYSELHVLPTLKGDAVQGVFTANATSCYEKWREERAKEIVKIINTDILSKEQN